MAKSRITFNEDGLQDLLNSPGVKQALMAEANKVRATAQSTAQAAQGGPGGKLTGYAEAGFTVEFVARGKRPEVRVQSNADPQMALRVYFASQKRDGVSHLRAALYANSTRGA